MKICVGESLKKTKLGLIVGAIHFEFKKQCFPEKNWTDFPVRLLAWWIDETLSARRAGKTEFDLRFMDGPYVVTFRKGDSDEWHAVCRDDSMRRTAEHREKATFPNLLNELNRAALRMLRRCETLGYHTTDVEFLRDAQRTVAPRSRVRAP